MEKRIYTTITTVQGYPEIQIWSDGSITYSKGNQYVLLSDPNAILKIANALRGRETEIGSINEFSKYVKDKPDDILFQRLISQMPNKDYKEKGKPTRGSIIEGPEL